MFPEIYLLLDKFVARPDLLKPIPGGRAVECRESQDRCRLAPLVP
jgi:hypothetical protein